MKSLLVAFLILANVGIASSASQQHFFPTRPSDAHLHSDAGILTSYGVGNDAGGFTIKREGKTETFYLGYPLTIDRTHYRCLPTPERTHDEDICKRWPAQIIIGKTRVRVTYWLDKLDDHVVKVSDQLTAVRS